MKQSLSVVAALVGQRALIMQAIELLRLQSWRISVVTGTPPQWLRGDGPVEVEAATQAYRETREATIWVDPNLEPDTQIKALYHELGHLVLLDAGIDDCDREYDVGVEYVCNLIADLME